MNEIQMERQTNSVGRRQRSRLSSSSVVCCWCGCVCVVCEIRRPSGTLFAIMHHSQCSRTSLTANSFITDTYRMPCNFIQEQHRTYRSSNRHSWAAGNSSLSALIIWWIYNIHHQRQVPHGQHADNGHPLQCPAAAVKSGNIITPLQNVMILHAPSDYYYSCRADCVKRRRRWWASHFDRWFSIHFLICSTSMLFACVRADGPRQFSRAQVRTTMAQSQFMTREVNILLFNKILFVHLAVCVLLCCSLYMSFAMAWCIGRQITVY